MSDPQNDLTEGWPAEADSEELRRFAEQLRAARPVMSEEALTRVGQTIRDEIATSRSRRKRWTVAVAAGLAAAVLLALVLMRHLSPSAPSPSGDNVAQSQPAEVHDSYEVELATPRAAAPDRPPLQIEDSQSLFAD